MKNIIILTIILLVASFLPVKAQSVKNISTKEFKEQIWNFDNDKEWKFKGDKPIIIDLFATWCPPCKKLSPILEEIQKQYGDKIQIYKVDVDKEPQIAQLFNATSIPLMVFVPQNGKPFTVAGLRPQEQLEQIITDRLDVKK